MKTLTYLDGQFLEDPKISALDLSVLRGYGVMDSIRTYGGVPFHLRGHLERFVYSADAVGLQAPLSVDEMEEIVHELVRRGGFDESGVKVVLTGGQSEDQFSPEGNPVFFAVVYPHFVFPKQHYDEGVKVALREYQRPFPKAKSIHYFPAIIALKNSNAFDVLFHDDKGWIRETGTANFFAVIEGRVVTPKEAVLEGITRKVVMELIEVEEREIHIDEISTFEGAFITSSNKEVMPVNAIGKHKINNGVIPLIIRNLMQSFANHTKLSEKNLLQNI